MKRLLIIAFLGLLSSITVGQVAALPTEKVVSNTLPSIVGIVAGDKAGTGFIADGLVYTCFHVVSGSKFATITFHDGSQVVALKAVAADAEKDIAILVADLGGRPSLLMGDYAGASVGSRAIVIGNPLGLSETVTEGIVSAKRSLTTKDILQLSAGISHGSSGSPVLNDRGQVIGMVTSSIEGGQLLNLAISGRDLKACYGVSFDAAFLAKTPDPPAPKSGDLSEPHYLPTWMDPKVGVLQGIEFLPVVVEEVKPALGVSRSDLETWTKLKLLNAMIPTEQPTKPQLNSFRASSFSDQATRSTDTCTSTYRR